MRRPRTAWAGSRDSGARPPRRRLLLRAVGVARRLSVRISPADVLQSGRLPRGPDDALNSLKKPFGDATRGLPGRTSAVILLNRKRRTEIHSVLAELERNKFRSTLAGFKMICGEPVIESAVTRLGPHPCV